MSLVSQPQVALSTSVSFQCLLACYWWCCLFLCWVSPSRTIWTIISLSLWQSALVFVYVTMIDQKGIAVVFFSLCVLLFSCSRWDNIERLPSILLSAMFHTICNIKQVIYMVQRSLSPTAVVAPDFRIENAKRPVIIGKIGGEDNKKSVSYSNAGESRQNSNSFQLTQWI